jgi:5-methylcytosine-specific restriction endonuclease McrA
VRHHRKKIARAIRLAVYERDNWTCQYCARRIEPQTESQSTGVHAPMTNWDSNLVWLELDHIVPYSLNGTDTLENLRSACSPCNRQKLASTREVDWEVRANEAVAILANPGIDRAAVQAAARVLLGVNVRLAENGRVTL